MKKNRLLACAVFSLLLVGAGCFSKQPSMPTGGTGANPPVTGCTKELKVCPDGATVGRVPPTCEFAPCPANVPDGTACTMEAKQCPDGSYVGRVPPTCEFAPCPGPARSCKNVCGNGKCDEIVCEAVGCPCAETGTSCPQDCKTLLPPS